MSSVYHKSNKYELKLQVTAAKAAWGPPAISASHHQLTGAACHRPETTKPPPGQCPCSQAENPKAIKCRRTLPSNAGAFHPIPKGPSHEKALAFEAIHRNRLLSKPEEQVENSCSRGCSCKWSSPSCRNIEGLGKSKHKRGQRFL